ncbi:hypothetical protein [Ureibacillus chungkukjangi]|uniref:Uncharacterized protein n=1 Tax=Ureibacillus chungkukjangi TaxID=1202712 RepID=A0A318TR25_9BACL|nr:hypothetical protein [Ureibacillus chungkukjangi]MCM3390062.1 hypothetical protein [Ureibacillus chungkukjangi]PYF07271.1 hypothetical protein BJ095_10561 [Ureibacillus chungkukjangi]
MYAVHFYERNTLFISKLLNEVPTEGSEIKLKGRKGIVTQVSEVQENKYHVQIELEAIKKVPLVSALDKKKRK